MSLQYQITPVTAFAQNCTLLWDSNTQEAVIVDLGGDIPKLQQAITKYNLHIKELWLTHGHLDHVSGVPDWVSEHNIPVYGPHIDDLFWLEGLPQITQMYGFPPTQAFTPNHWLNDGEQLAVGQYTFEVLHIPGHTPGHVVFYCASEKLLLAGDVLFYHSIGRTDFPKGSHSDLLHYIRTKILTLPEDVQVIAGHGRMTTIGEEKYHNPFLISD